MNGPSEYAREANKTVSPVTADDLIKLLQEKPEMVDYLHILLGLSSEIGEVADQLKRAIFYGKELDIVNLKEEIGDIRWYLGLFEMTSGTGMPELERMNREKLKKRFGDKFTKEKVLNRDLEAERKVLESA